MKVLRIVAYAARLASWLGAAALIGLTSDSIKQDWNDAVYVINAAFLVFGGLWLGDKLVARISAFSEGGNTDIAQDDGVDGKRD